MKIKRQARWAVGHKKEQRSKGPEWESEKPALDNFSLTLFVLE